MGGPEKFPAVFLLATSLPRFAFFWVVLFTSPQSKTILNRPPGESDSYHPRFRCTTFPLKRLVAVSSVLLLRRLFFLILCRPSGELVLRTSSSLLESLSLGFDLTLARRAAAICRDGEKQNTGLRQRSSFFLLIAAKFFCRLA